MNKKMSGYGFFVVLITVFFISARSDAADVKLDDLIGIALKRNPEIMAARSKWESKTALIVPAKTLPDINVGLSFENMPDETADMRYRGRKVFIVNQRYPFPGKLSLAGKIAESEGDVYKHIYAGDKWAVLTKIKKAYYEYFYIQKSLEIFNQEEEILKHFSRVAEQRYLIGREKQINVLKAQVELSKVLNKVITLEKLRVSVQARINSILDYPSEKSLGRVAEPEYSDWNFDWADIRKMVKKNSPVLREKFERERKSFRSLSLARKNYMPDFGLTFKSREVSDDFTGIDLGVNMNLPLYFWKQKGVVKSRDADYKSSRAGYRNAVNEIDYAITDIATQIDTHDRLYKLFKTNFIPQARQAKDVAGVGYKSGTLIFLDWLDTERSYLDFQLEYWEHLKDYLKGLADLERIAGMNIADIVEEKK